MALDIDGTLADVHTPIVEEWNKITGKAFAVSDIDNYNWKESKLQMPTEEFFRIYEELWNEKSDRIKPTITEEELLNFVKHFDVDIVTARPPGTENGLQKWLRRNFPSLRLRVVVVGHTLDKLKDDYNIIIDDAPSIWAAFHQNDHLTEGKWLYVPMQPWNSRTILSMPPSHRMATADTTANALRLARSQHAYEVKNTQKKNAVSA